MEPITIVQHAHVERSGGGAFFFVASNMEIPMVCAAVRQPMDEPGVPVERKNNWLVLGKKGIENHGRSIHGDVHGVVAIS